MRLSRLTLYLLVVWVLIGIGACRSSRRPVAAEASNSYVAKIEAERREKDASFRNPDSSPLTAGDRRHFEALPYFPIDEGYRVRARLERTPDADPFQMQVTRPRPAPYVQYGIVHFELAGDSLSLPVYKSLRKPSKPEYANLLFLPFKDLTNGESTYGGGRYLDLPVPAADVSVVELDFNRAYNPYCAYSARYSCPVVSDESKLRVAVRAGVRYNGDH